MEYWPDVLAEPRFWSPSCSLQSMTARAPTTRQPPLTDGVVPAVVYAALLIPALVDLGFVGRRPDAVVSLASTGTALVVVWWLAAPLVLAHAGRRSREFAPAEAGPWLTTGLLCSLLPAAALAAAGWLVLAVAFDIPVLAPLVVDAGLEYGRIRLFGLPGLAALLIFVEYFELRGRRAFLLIGLAVLNLANLGLNFASEPLVGFAAISTEAGLAVATVASTWIAVFVLAGCIVYDRDEPEQLLVWSTDRIRRFLLASTAAPLLWLVPATGLIGAFVLVGAADQATIAEGVGAARDQLAPIRPDTPPGDDLPVAVLLAADWSEVLARSRPPLFLAAASVLVALCAVWMAAALGFATTVARRIRAAMTTHPPDEIEHRGWSALLVSLAPVGVCALPLVAVPHRVIVLLTDSSAVVAEAAPALRLVGAHSLFFALAVGLVAIHDAVGSTRFATATVTAATGGAAAVAALSELVFSLRLMGISWAGTLGAAATAGALALNFWRANWKTRDD